MPTEVTRRRALAAAGSSLFFALAPGMVAGVVPWWPRRRPWVAGPPGEAA